MRAITENVRMKLVECRKVWVARGAVVRERGSLDPLQLLTPPFESSLSPSSALTTENVITIKVNIDK